MIKKFGLYIVLIIVFVTIGGIAISFSNKQVDETTAYKNFKQKLAKIPVKNINSAIVGKDLTVKFLKNTKDQKLKNKAYVDYENFYNQVYEKLDFTYAGYKCKVKDFFGCRNIKNPQHACENDYKIILKYINTKGFDLYLEDESFTPSENIDFLYKNFVQYLSKDWQEYLKIQDIEYKKPCVYEKYLAISPEELRNRIVYVEKYLKKYPSFEKNKEAKKFLECNLLLTYYDNSHLWFIPSKSLSNSDVILSYENFLKDNKDSQYYQEVKNHYILLKETNFNIEDKRISTFNNQIYKKYCN